MSQPREPDAGGPSAAGTTGAGVIMSRTAWKGCSRSSTTPMRKLRPVSALATGRDIKGAGGLGAADLGHFRSEQDSPAEHRARVGPGPAAGEVSRPRIGPGRAFEPARLELAEGDVDLQDRPA